MRQKKEKIDRVSKMFDEENDSKQRPEIKKMSHSSMKNHRLKISVTQRRKLRKQQFKSMTPKQSMLHFVKLTEQICVIAFFVCWYA